MDFNAGALLEGESMESLSARLRGDVLRIASGDGQTRAEQRGVRGLYIFKSGVTL